MLGRCLVPNHRHFVLWLEKDRALSDFLRLLTLVQKQRWHADRGSTGTGRLYPKRFESFALQDDAHLLAPCRHLERNALRVRSPVRAQDWPGSSSWRLVGARTDEPPRLCEWPALRRKRWMHDGSEPRRLAEIEAVRVCARRSAPCGRARRRTATARWLGMKCALREGRRPCAEKSLHSFFGAACIAS